MNGPPFVPLFTRSIEYPGVCGDTDQFEDPIDTEGFISALLRDIDDDGQDDHDDDPDPDVYDVDGIFDLLCLGPNEIFFVTDQYAPVTIIDFINGFLTEYPQHTDLFWPTAFNVGGAQYVSMFPADAEPPGVVTTLDSTTHPLGIGGLHLSPLAQIPRIPPQVMQRPRRTRRRRVAQPPRLPHRTHPRIVRLRHRQLRRHQNRLPARLRN